MCQFCFLLFFFCLFINYNVYLIVRFIFCEQSLQYDAFANVKNWFYYSKKKLQQLSNPFSAELWSEVIIYLVCIRIFVIGSIRGLGFILFYFCCIYLDSPIILTHFTYLTYLQRLLSSMDKITAALYVKCSFSVVGTFFFFCFPFWFFIFFVKLMYKFVC